MSRTHLTRIAFALLAIGFFATPIAARGLGITAQAFENRAFATAPKLSQGWDAFQQTTQFLIDRMPLRAQAVRANTQIWTNLFNTDPHYNQQTPGDDNAIPFAGKTEDGGDASDDPLAAPGASDLTPGTGPWSVAGDEGWLFAGDEFTAACYVPVSHTTALRRWGRLTQALRTRRRQVVVLVVPDKGSVYPEHLPDDYPVDDCSPKAKERFWDVLAREGPAYGVLELRTEMRAQKAFAGDDLYLRKDSHWSSSGALVMVARILDAVGGGVHLSLDDVVDHGPMTYVGDLTNLRGNPETDTTHDRRIVRPPSSSRVPGKTVLLGDSFSERAEALLEPYFERLDFMGWSSDTKTVRTVHGADTVVIETAERFFRQRSADGSIDSLIKRSLARHR